ncbi:MAG: hemerythrin domain-containing protein [Candidatus Hydrogenedentes bacterium]|nr:hemerythrin domain-containing protein [Candidatus Hydrogenedentota bacterium]
MAVHVGGKPLADFSAPIEMMKDCHRRIEHFLEVLQAAERRFGGSNLDEEGRHALDASLNYFANFAPRHTADEEQSLFPRMRSSGDLDARAVLADLERLANDHRGCEALHAHVHGVVSNWLGTGRLDATQRSGLRAALDELIRIYAAHIQLEEGHVFVVADRILRAEQIQEIGEEMRERRSLAGLGHTGVSLFEKERLQPERPSRHGVGR